MGKCSNGHDMHFGIRKHPVMVDGKWDFEEAGIGRGGTVCGKCGMWGEVQLTNPLNSAELAEYTAAYIANETTLPSLSAEDSSEGGYDIVQDTTPTGTPSQRFTPAKTSAGSSSALCDIASSPAFFFASSQAANLSYLNTTTPTQGSKSAAPAESLPAADVLQQLLTKNEARQYAIAPRADTLLRDHVRALRDWLEVRLLPIKPICAPWDDCLADILTARLSMGEAGVADALLNARKANFNELERLWPLVCDIRDNIVDVFQQFYSGLNPSCSAVFNATLVPPGLIIDRPDIIDLSSDDKKPANSSPCARASGSKAVQHESAEWGGVTGTSLRRTRDVSPEAWYSSSPRKSFGSIVSPSVAEEKEID